MKVRAIQGDTLDSLCYREKGDVQGYLETVIAANPGLADLGPILPMGTIVNLPEVASTGKINTATVNLWD